MLRLDVFSGGSPAKDFDLVGAYMFGQDHVPIRAEMAFSDGQITCSKRVAGACGLSLVADAAQSGRFMLPSARLQDRDKPYNLNVEMARGQIMRIAQKCEEWGLFDFRDAKGLYGEFEQLRREFVSTLTAKTPEKAAARAAKVLCDGVTLGEKIALFHADIFLSRRKASSSAAARTGFGCEASLQSANDNYRDRLREAFDFASIPTPWKETEPKESLYQYDKIDALMNWAGKINKPIHAGPLVDFRPAQLPEWLHLREHDYEALREVIYEQIQRTVQRYAKQVRVWRVISGIHAHNPFNLNFEQIMELTRVSCLLVKQIAPESQVLIDLDLPWGEYYARNQRTIPPMLYSEMAVQSGIKFDAFGLPMTMGVPVEGHFVRDLMQISSRLDAFVSLGKSVHVTTCQVPSDSQPDRDDAWGGEESIPRAGQWHAPWSPRLQAEWLQAFYRIAISKPFVNTICWGSLADSPPHYLPHGGLCSADAEPKLSYRELRNFKAALATGNGVVNQKKRKGSKQ